MAKLFRFIDERSGNEFVAEEGSVLYWRAVRSHRADNRMLGEVDAPKRGRGKAKAEADAPTPVADEAPAE
jgi:hypothetical protein